MSKLLLSLLIGSIFLSACRKENFTPVYEPTIPCKFQTDNPAGRSYTSDAVISLTCTEKHCGILPLSSKNYWIYEDSIFNNGVFLKVQFDTLRFTANKKTISDGLIWWEGNLFIGLPETLYANESAFFNLSERLFTPDILDAKKEFSIPAGDSLNYLTSFEDAAAQGRSIKLTTPVSTSFGTFNDCLYFEKNARNYRKEQVFFKPGLGVVKFIYEKAPIGKRVIELQQISTLVGVHIE